MSYENPEVPHEVNVQRERPLLEFLRLAAGLALLVAVVSALLYFAGGALARYIPFATERSWVGDRVIGLEIRRSTSGEAAQVDARIQAYVAQLADSIASQMALPDGMQVQAHYTNLEVPNAFATLGGHIVVTSGLYRRMPTENALAMVLAHEIAHLQARDPIAALGGAATLGVVLTLLSGQAERLAPYLAQVIQRGYSRRAEARADAAAVAALQRLYGHAGGAASVFEILARSRGIASGRVPTFLSTHPADEERIAALRQAAAGWVPARAPLRALAVAPPPPPRSASETSRGARR